MHNIVIQENYKIEVVITSYMNQSVGEKIFCPHCGDYITPRIERTATPTGELIIEYYCPRHGLIKTEKKKNYGGNPAKIPGGLYIALEGIDGSGKTTQASLLYEYLTNKGYSVIVVREPWVQAIKEVLYKYNLDVEAEVYLFAADRIILQREIVLPALSEGKIVISDRTLYASLAYQSSRGADQDFIRRVNKFVKPPDIVFLLDIPVEKAMERLRNRSFLTRFEDPTYMYRVREKYLKLAEEEKDKFIVLDASGTIEEVYTQLVDKVEEILQNLKANKT